MLGKLDGIKVGEAEGILDGFVDGILVGNDVTASEHTCPIVPYEPG